MQTQPRQNRQSGIDGKSVKSRQLGLTFVAASLGLAVVLLSQGKAFSIDFRGWHVHVAVLLVVAAAMSMAAVRHLDLNVYHKMLRGAVAFGEDLEQTKLLDVLGSVEIQDSQIG